MNLFCIKNEELCIKNEEFCIKNEEFAFKMMNLADIRRDDREPSLRSVHGAFKMQICFFDTKSII